MDWVSLFLGGVVGAASSWAITFFFHRRAMKEQRKLREEDRKALRLEREAQANQREYESSRSNLYRVRESSFNEYKAKAERRWDAEVNGDGTITLTNLRDEIDNYIEFSLEGEGAGYGTFMRFSKLQKGGSITFSLPHGLNEVDGIVILALAGSSYPERETVPLHPRYTMFDFRDPRT